MYCCVRIVSVAKCLKYGGIFSDHFTANGAESSSERICGNLSIFDKIMTNSVAYFLGHSVQALLIGL